MQRQFDFSGATARKRDPVTSFIAADKMNDNNMRLLSKQQRIVMRALMSNDGATAKELGTIMAQTDIERYSWGWKRMKQLHDEGYVRRELPEGGREYLCFITESGKKYLEKKL